MAARIDWHLFALFLEVKRIVRGITYWKLSRQAHVSPAIVRQAMTGRPLDDVAFSKLCAWQNEAPEIFHARGPDDEATR